MSEKLFIVGKRTAFLEFAVAVFRDRDAAQAWADNANEWYTAEHPLVLLTVWANTVDYEPSPFPVEALMSGGNIFDDIDK